MSPFNLTKYLKRIGEKDVEKFFKTSLIVNAGEIIEKEMWTVMVYRVVQKSISFPTDSKRWKKGKMAVKRIRTVVCYDK